MKFVAFSLLLVFSSIHAQDYEARLEWGQTMALGTLVSGVVSQVRVKPGQNVKKGDLLIALDDREFVARLRLAKALAAQTTALQQEAERELQRALELYDQGMLSEHDLQQAKIANLDAASRQAEAAMKYTQAQLDLERSRILAPANGQIREIHTWVGQPVQNQQAIQSLVLMVKAGDWSFRLMIPGRPGDFRPIQVIRGKDSLSTYGLQFAPIDGKNLTRVQGKVHIPGAMPGELIKIRLQ